MSSISDEPQDGNMDTAASSGPVHDGDVNAAESAGAAQGVSGRRPPSSEPSLSADVRHLRSIALQMPCIGRGLFISGLGGVSNRKILQEQGITHILNLARELKDTSFPEHVSVRFVALRDSDEEDLLPWLPELVEHVHLAIDDGGKICVNCVAGVSRSASICLAYKVRHEGLSLREAFDEVLAARPVISPNLGFWKALLQWEVAVRGENSVVMRPYICGMVPELQSYVAFTEMRVKLGWADDLVAMWAFHLLLFLLQVISIMWM